MTYYAGAPRMSMTGDEIALRLILEGADQATLANAARIVKSKLIDDPDCPNCGKEGPHDTNGATQRSELSYCCAGCGEHFDAESV